jgi:hypothetical protein
VLFSLNTLPKSTRSSQPNPSTEQPRGCWTRRNLLWAAAGIPIPALLPRLAQAAQTKSVRWLSVRYRTDPKRISAILPPPLTPDVLADVLVNYWSVIPPISRHSIAEPGPSHWFAVYVSAKYKNHRGMLALGMVTNHDWARINAREYLGFNAKDGAVKLELDGKKVSASCSRHGSLLNRVETVVTGRAADSLYGWGETGYGAFVYHYRPNPDWPNGLLGGENAELWKVAGNDRGYAAESPRASAPQVCDISQTRFEWGRPSVSDPYSEFPVREFVGASYRELTSPDAASWRERAESPKTVFLQAVPKEAFQAWSLLNYDRPQKDRSNKDRSKSGRPKGAAVQSSRAVSPVKLTRQELSRYRSGKELALHSVNMVDFQIAVKATTHAAVLPPPCEPGSRPILRVLALRVETSDLSVRPFHEAWLFAYCRVGGRPLWYALSHIVSEDGDVLHGRETFGYPSLHGNIDAMVTTEGFSLSASRQGREFVRGEGSVRGFSTGTSLAKIDIVGLRAGPFQEGEAPRGELVAQTWFFQGRRLYGDPKIAKLEFPARKAPGGIGRPSPWFEFTPFHLMSAAGVEDVGMQRGPGRIVAQVTDFTPYYRERCDGLLPGEQPPVTSVQPTFLGQRLPATRPGRVRGRVESESAGAAKNGDTAR